ncbi:MAG: diacylglycerol kinase family protein [Polyangiales bacterium]
MPDDLPSSVVRTSSTTDLPLSIVMNVASGSGEPERRRREMQEILTAAGRKHEFFLVRDPRQVHQVAHRAAEHAVKESGAVVAAGGDGTINAVAQATLPTGRPFGIVPLGTFNYSGRAHAIPLDHAGATRALLTAKLEPMQVGMVNGRVFLVNASLGLYPQLLQDREAAKKQFGRYRGVAMLSALGTVLRGNGQLTLELEHESGREIVRTPSLFVGNNALQLEQAGLPEAEEVRQRRKLAGVIVNTSGVRGLLSLMLHGARGKLGEAQEVRDFAFETLTVRPAMRGVRKLKVALDGEIHWMRPPVAFSVAPEPLQLLSPKPRVSARRAEAG